MSGSSDVRRVLLSAYESTEDVYCGYYDDTPVLLFGVVPLDTAQPIGTVWCLGTEEIERHPFPLYRMGRQWVDKLTARYSALANYVHADNALAIKWLRWLGFEFPNYPVASEINGQPYHFFVRRACVPR